MRAAVARIRRNGCRSTGETRRPDRRAHGRADTRQGGRLAAHPRRRRGDHRRVRAHPEQDRSGQEHPCVSRGHYRPHRDPRSRSARARRHGGAERRALRDGNGVRPAAAGPLHLRQHVREARRRMEAARRDRRDAADRAAGAEGRRARARRLSRHLHLRPRPRVLGRARRRQAVLHDQGRRHRTLRSARSRRTSS